MIAGGGVRAVLELAGIHDVLSKSLGSQNPINLVKATIAGCRACCKPEEVAELRGLPVSEVLGSTGATDGPTSRRCGNAGPPSPPRNPRADGQAAITQALANGANPKQRETLRTLGLGRIGRPSSVRTIPLCGALIHRSTTSWRSRMADKRRSACTTSSPPPGSRQQAQAASGAARARATARPPGAATRAPARARAPSASSRFEGGQNPIHMRMRKLRGPHMKKSMPFEQFRTHTQPVNLDDLEARFDDGAEVTPETLRETGLATRKDVPVKILGRGELSKTLTVHAHGFCAAAREKIEAAGGTSQVIEG